MAQLDLFKNDSSSGIEVQRAKISFSASNPSNIQKVNHQSPTMSYYGSKVINQPFKPLKSSKFVLFLSYTSIIIVTTQTDIEARLIAQVNNLVSFYYLINILSICLLLLCTHIISHDQQHSFIIKSSALLTLFNSILLIIFTPIYSSSCSYTFLMLFFAMAATQNILFQIYSLGILGFLIHEYMWLKPNYISFYYLVFAIFDLLITYLSSLRTYQQYIISSYQFLICICIFFSNSLHSMCSVKQLLFGASVNSTYDFRFGNKLFQLFNGGTPLKYLIRKTNSYDILRMGNPISTTEQSEVNYTDPDIQKLKKKFRFPIRQHHLLGLLFAALRQYTMRITHYDGFAYKDNQLPFDLINRLLIFLAYSLTFAFSTLIYRLRRSILVCISLFTMVELSNAIFMVSVDSVDTNNARIYFLVSTSFVSLAASLVVLLLFENIRLTKQCLEQKISQVFFCFVVGMIVGSIVYVQNIPALLWILVLSGSSLFVPKM